MVNMNLKVLSFVLANLFFSMSPPEALKPRRHFVAKLNEKQ